MTDLYQIRDWDRNFENNKSRERDSLAWCPIPNKQDGLGYGLLMRHPNGAALYGAFVAVVLVCSKQAKPRAGYLTDTGAPDGRPMTSADLSIKTQVPADIIESMLVATSDPAIGWIASARQVPAECPPSARVVPPSGRKEEKEEKKPYGELGSVRLSDGEIEKLRSRHDSDSLAAAIEILDGYIASKGKKYASHYAVLKDGSWVWDRVRDRGIGSRPKPVGMVNHI